MRQITSIRAVRGQRMAWRRLLGAAMLALPLSAPLAASGTVSPACAGAEYRQFDFWIGNWDAYDKDGKLVGHNLIEKIEQGCVLQEWWRGEGEANGAGTSLSIYDRQRRLWNHTWTSVRGNLLPIEGGWLGDRMVMTGYHIEADGRRALHRTVWKPVPGGVYHLWDVSTDGGHSWEVIHEAWLRPSQRRLEK